MTVAYRTQAVGPVEVFYREAGPADTPVILLLHGFPTTSHMFRDLIPQLAGRYRVIAPDLPGFGLTEAPPRGQFDYTFDNLAAVIGGFTEAIRTQYVTCADASLVSPDGYTLDVAHFAREGTDEVQLDLIYDYRTNVALYGAWQDYFREYQLPLLAVWGDKDPYFLPPGAKAFRRDIPDAELRFLDTGHFALETHGEAIGEAMLDFLGRRVAA